MERVNVDISKMLKWPAKFWYQNRSNPIKADENISNTFCSKQRVDNFDPEEGKWSKFEKEQEQPLLADHPKVYRITHCFRFPHKEVKYCIRWVNERETLETSWAHAACFMHAVEYCVVRKDKAVKLNAKIMDSGVSRTQMWREQKKARQAKRRAHYEKNRENCWKGRGSQKEKSRSQERTTAVCSYQRRHKDTSVWTKPAEDSLKK